MVISVRMCVCTLPVVRGPIMQLGKEAVFTSFPVYC